MIVEVDDGPDDFDDDEVNAYVAEFQSNIDASPEFVYVVIGTDDLPLGVASTAAKAEAIADARGSGCVIVPYKIDDPAWGNREHD